MIPLDGLHGPSSTGRSHARSAFTLIELLIVIVILAILMAIAIPTLLNQRNKARDADAKNDATLVFRTLRASFDDTQWRSDAGALIEDTIAPGNVRPVPVVLASETGLTGTLVDDPAQLYSVPEGRCAISISNAGLDHDGDPGTPTTPYMVTSCHSKSGRWFVITDVPNAPTLLTTVNAVPTTVPVPFKAAFESAADAQANTDPQSW